MSPLSSLRTLLLAGTALIAVALSGGTTTSLHAQSTMQVIASGLDNPRGLAFGPDGALYVAEAGRGGTSGLCEPGPGGALRCYGPTGAITRITNIGVHQRVLTGLPSIAADTGNEAAGPNDIQFGFGSAWVLVGYGSDPANRAQFEQAGIQFGSLIRVLFTGHWDYLVDVSAHEAANNPDGGHFDSNPFGLQLLSDRGLVADAGANALLEISATGQLSTLAVFPDRTVTLPSGDVVIQSVPTSVTVAPDGSYFVGELTGAPFPKGHARVYRVPAGGGVPQVVATGFTNIIDVLYDSDTGNGYVLEHDADGIIPPLGPGVDGRLIRFNPNGTQTVIAHEGLVKPGGVTVGPDGALYVTTRSNQAEVGGVVRIVP